MKEARMLNRMLRILQAKSTLWGRVSLIAARIFSSLRYTVQCLKIDIFVDKFRKTLRHIVSGSIGEVSHQQVVHSAYFRNHRRH